MLRRLFWFVLGVVAGIYGTLWVRNAASEISQRLSPSAILEQVVEVIRLGFAKLREVATGAPAGDEPGSPVV